MVRKSWMEEKKGRKPWLIYSFKNVILFAGNDVRVIDSEFAMAGPIAFDTGLLLANYLFSYIRHTSMDTSTG